MSENRNKLDAIVGLVAVGSSVTGVASSIVAILTFLSEELIAARVCLIAAALSFGLLTNAVFLGPRLSHREPQGGP